MRPTEHHRQGHRRPRNRPSRTRVGRGGPAAFGGLSGPELKSLRRGCRTAAEEHSKAEARLPLSHQTFTTFCSIGVHQCANGSTRSPCAWCGTALITSRRTTLVAGAGRAPGCGASACRRGRRRLASFRDEGLCSSPEFRGVTFPHVGRRRRRKGIAARQKEAGCRAARFPVGRSFHLFQLV